MWNEAAPVHPGAILHTEFLERFGISQYRIARAINVPPGRINDIVHGKRAISIDTGLRLARALGVADMFWINLQACYDADQARGQIAAQLRIIEPIVGSPRESAHHV
ncbi:HigA family addiction module antitoxin [Mycobacterium szulgai]|uniref:XRE family transcriptional regulator n=1 Tax=Mycobacterium szulgai TaxID=1787 RepID=A0A1X2EQ41_MYCSZ|nr:HigA family addiction module antitoxin [Mycobacterium szulgai]MCV7079166.1 HigA family addiction module antidote protein [Mycobacterium szulgai]ORX08282.1 XRE family transcriptional regulator [Mycobacterium szulgai]